MPQDILKLYDAQGNLRAVQISPELWLRLEPTLTPPRASHDWPGFQEFQDAWNFPYAYSPDVTCPSCGAHTDDWRQGEDFLLTSAGLGGMLVFRCSHCQGTVRQKYFKSHVAREFTPGAAYGSDGAK